MDKLDNFKSKFSEVIKKYEEYEEKDYLNSKRIAMYEEIIDSLIKKIDNLKIELENLKLENRKL